MSKKPESSNPTADVPRGNSTPLKAVPGEKSAEKPFETLILVALASIEPNPWQPRIQFDEAELQELAESIQTHGLLQKPVVRPKPGASGKFQLIAGERRWRAAKLAGLKDIAVFIRDADDRAMAELALTENAQRKDVNAIESARALARLRDEFGVKQDEMAKKAGVSHSLISNRLRLLELPAEVQNLIETSQISEAHGKALLPHKAFPELVAWYAAKIAAKGIPAKTVEQGLDVEWKELDELTKKKLVIRCGYYIDLAQARKAHPGAFVRSTGAYGGWLCLDVKLHDELIKAAQAASERAKAKKLEQASAGAKNAGGKAGKTIPKVSDLKWGSYERLDSKRPAGCDDNCPCLGKALDYAGKECRICTDPKRHQKLKAAETRAQNAKQREENQRKMTRVEAHMDELRIALSLRGALGKHAGSILYRVAALAALPHLQGAQLAILEKSAKRLSLDFDAKKFKDYKTGATTRLDMLAALGDGPLLSLLIQVIVGADLENVISGYGYHGFDSWFLKGLPVIAPTAASPPVAGDDSDVDLHRVRSISGGSAEDLNWKNSLEAATARELELALEALETQNGAKVKTAKVQARLKSLRKEE